MTSSGPDDDRGSVLIAALGALLVMTLLAGWALQAAVAGSDGTGTDARAKQALQAAEAGLQRAVYRLSMLQPAAGRCVAETVVDPVAGVCPPTTPEQLGNGSSFSYRTTPALGASATCAGLLVRTQLALTQRCVTATGTTDGVTRRVQTRVAAYASTPLFPVAGLLGLDAVTLNGNVTIPTTTAATNGTLTATGNVRTAGTVLGPAGTTRTTGNVAVSPVARRTADEGPFVLGDVDPGTSATVNDNGRIVRGLRTPPVAPYDAISTGSSVTYDAPTRALRAAGNATITLGGGVYNFCSVSITGNLTLIVAAGAKVAWYVDSPDDPNGGCPPGSGGFAVGGNLSSGSASSDPTAFQLYVYGTDDRRQGVTIRGNAALHAAIYAPRSDVSIVGNAQVIGGVAARTVTMTGNGFVWDDRAGTLQTGSAGGYHRTAWRECPSATTAAC
jgi:Tfp pilus assembly protein PilX